MLFVGRSHRGVFGRENVSALFITYIIGTCQATRRCARSWPGSKIATASSFQLIKFENHPAHERKNKVATLMNPRRQKNPQSYSIKPNRHRKLPTSSLSTIDQFYLFQHLLTPHHHNLDHHLKKSPHSIPIQIDHHADHRTKVPISIARVPENEIPPIQSR